MRRLALPAALLTFAVALFLGWLVHVEFLRYQPRVDRLISKVSPATFDTSAEALVVFEKLAGDGLPWLGTRVLLWTSTAHVRMGRWHVRSFLWQYLLPLRLSDDTLFMTYLGYLPCEGGAGIEYCARTYFMKKPAELSTDEAIQLYVISRAPSYYSPSRNSERFREAFERAKVRYRSAV